MDNEPTRPLGGTTMNTLIINNSVTTEEALASNKVLMVGRIKNRRELEMEQIMSTNKVLMAGRLPNKREVEMSKPTVTVVNVPVKATTATTDNDVVEIPAFLLKAQEERKVAIANKNKKKKAPNKKPSLKSLIVNTLKSL